MDEHAAVLPQTITAWSRLFPHTFSDNQHKHLTTLPPSSYVCTDIAGCLPRLHAVRILLDSSYVSLHLSRVCTGQCMLHGTLTCMRCDNGYHVTSSLSHADVLDLLPSRYGDKPTLSLIIPALLQSPRGLQQTHQYLFIYADI